MIGKLEKQWGGIPEVEAEILDGIDLDLKECKNRAQVNAILKQVEKTCKEKKQEFTLFLENESFSKAELREFSYELRKEIVQLVEEQDSMPSSEENYLTAMSDVIFLFREVLSIIEGYIDNEITVCREEMTSLLEAMI